MKVDNGVVIFHVLVQSVPQVPATDPALHQKQSQWCLRFFLSSQTAIIMFSSMGSIMQSIDTDTTRRTQNYI